MEAKTFCLSIILVVTSACNAATEQAEGQAMISMAVSPAAAPIAPALAYCANQSESIRSQYRIEELFPSQFDSTVHDLVIQIGEVSAPFSFSAQIGEERFFLVTHLSNPLTQLDTNTLAGIFSGAIANWSEIGGDEEPIELWVATESDESRQFLANELLNGQSVSSNAKLSISPEKMLISISENEGAIGLSTGAWINSSVSSMALLGSHPVIAASASEPQGAVREIIACLQSGAGQQMISEIYTP